VCCRGRRISGCKQPVRTSSFLVLLLGRKVELTWANSTVHTVPVVYTLVSVYLSVQSFLLDQFTSCASPSTTKEYNKKYIYIYTLHTCVHIYTSTPIGLYCTFICLNHIGLQQYPVGTFTECSPWLSQRGRTGRRGGSETTCPR